MFSGMGTVCKNTNFHGIKTDFLWKETIVHGEKKLAVQKEKKKESTGFSSTLNTHKTYRAHSHVAIARHGHVIVNTVTYCYYCRLAIGLNAAILTHFCTMFCLRITKHENFESEFSRGFGGGGGGR